MDIIYFILAIIAGALIPVQTSANTQLSKHLDGIFPATLAVFIVAVFAISIVLLLMRSGLPTVGQIYSAPLYSWLGGVIAVIYILALVYLAPRLGIGTVTVLVVSGQAIAIMTIEHFGLFGFTVKPINLYRILGTIFLVSGVYLIRKF